MKKTLLIILLLQACAPSKYLDMVNPCSSNPKYSDSVECETWKQNYPKEYAAYLNRIENDNANVLHLANTN